MSFEKSQVHEIPPPDWRGRGLIAGEHRGDGQFHDEITLSEASGSCNPPIVDITYSPPPLPPLCPKKI